MENLISDRARQACSGVIWAPRVPFIFLPPPSLLFFRAPLIKSLLTQGVCCALPHPIAMASGCFNIWRHNADVWSPQQPMCWLVNKSGETFPSFRSSFLPFRSKNKPGVLVSRQASFPAEKEKGLQRKGKSVQRVGCGEGALGESQDC